MLDRHGLLDTLLDYERYRIIDTVILFETREPSEIEEILSYLNMNRPLPLAVRARYQKRYKDALKDYKTADFNDLTRAFNNTDPLQLTKEIKLAWHELQANPLNLLALHNLIEAVS